MEPDPCDMRARHLHAALHTLEMLPVKYSTDYHPPPKLTYERALELPTIDVIATRHPWETVNILLANCSQKLLHFCSGEFTEG